jgi:hypothetical protein
MNIAKLTSVTAFSFVLASALTGCASSESRDDGAPIADDVEATESELQSMKYFDCNALGSIDSFSRFELGVSASKVVATDLSKNAMPSGMGTLDPSFRPTSSSLAGASRFKGFATILEGSPSDATGVEVLISPDVRALKASGRAWIRWNSGSGPATEGYICKAKAERLTVNTATNARVACNLNRIECKNDNPPGETCLAGAFISQSSSGTTLKLKYYDHFGVNAVERSVAKGSSTGFTRTKKALSGNWSSEALDLTYRAGITYVGKLKVDGKAVSVQCNDLSMLD